MKPLAEQFELIKRGVVHCITEEDLKRKLERAVKNGKPLRVKLGIDPTAPDIHLGHTIALRKLRAFQDCGHQAVLIIGDFTALIGDPSGRSKTRPPLTEKEVEHNAKTYLEQVSRILDMDKLEIVHNSQWLKPLSLTELIGLASKLTVARLMERDDFSKRLREEVDIGFHELLYPLMQGYDSVVVKADVELGGTDQLFNLVMGRRLQRAMGQEEQVALTMPILVGLDGKERMSKSLGNYVGVTEPAFEMYSKIMSLPDEAMKDYFTLLTNIPSADIAHLTDSKKAHPMEAKKRLAGEVCFSFHSKGEVEEAAQRWDMVMSKKELPEDVPELTINRSLCKENNHLWIVKLLSLTKLVNSNSEARRLVEQGGVELDGKRITDPDAELALQDGNILKVGKKKRYFKIVLR